MKFNIKINSFYVSIVRVKYTGAKYIKAHIRYHYKTSGLPFHEEKNVKLMKSSMKHWEVYND
jgi:hypothetical protein